MKKKIITSTDSTVKIWDAQTGAILGQLKGHTNYISSASFSPDSKKIATASDDGTAKTWDAQTGKMLNDLKGHTTFVFNAAFSPDGKKIITGAWDGSVKIWDVQTGTLLAHLQGHTKYVDRASFSPDGEEVVAASADGKAKIWDAQSGKLLINLKGQTEFATCMSFSADGKKIVTGEWNGTVKVWDVQTGSLLAGLKGHTSYVRSAAFSQDNKKIVSTSDDGTAKIWDAQTGSILMEIKGLVPYNVNITSFSPDGKKTVTGTNDKTVKIWDVETGKLLVDLKEQTEWATSASFAPDGKKVVTSTRDFFSKGTLDNTAKIWDAQTGSLLTELKGHTSFISNASFSPDGTKIVTASGDRTSKIWDAQTGSLLADLKGHTNNVQSASFSPDGKKILTTSGDNTCKIWNAETGRLLYTFFAVDSSDYLITDEYGRYDGTETARKLLYFTCGTEAITLEQVKDQLWVPNLVERINKGDSINAKKLSDLDICGLIPKVEQEEKSAYHFHITLQRGGLGETVLSVNGIEVNRYKPVELVQTADGFELNIPEKELKPYFIAGQQNPVTVKAYTAKNDISSRMAQAMQDETSKKAEAPNLYAVMIGVSDYKSLDLQLKYAAKDAADISKAVASSARKLLNTDGKEHVYMYDLTTNKEHYQLPEKIAIKNIFTEIGKKASANDILMIFFSGHGVSSGGQKQFYFLTADASQATAIDAPAEVGISTKELSEWMKPSIIKAQKRILILDACNSGRVINEMVKIGDANQNYVAARNDDRGEQIKAIDKLNEKSGLFILAASTSNQGAYEMSLYNQGLLTYALLKAIKQQPDVLEDGKYLNVSRWFGAAEKTVSDIVRQIGTRQEPQIIGAGNFNIGVVDQEVMAGIKLAEEKPLFTASNLQNNDPDIAADDLHLNSLLDMQLNEIAARGDDNAITYIPGSASPDAYSLSGRYAVKSDGMNLKINIRQNNVTRYRFELTGTKSDLKALAEQVINQATEWIVKNAHK